MYRSSTGYLVLYADNALPCLFPLLCIHTEENKLHVCSLMKMTYGITPAICPPPPPLPRYARFPTVHLCHNTLRHYIKPSNNKSSFMSWECARLCTNGSRIQASPPPSHSAAILAFCLNLAISLHWCQGYGSGKGSVFMWATASGSLFGIRIRTKR